MTILKRSECFPRFEIGPASPGDEVKVFGMTVLYRHVKRKLPYSLLAERQSGKKQT